MKANIGEWRSDICGAISVSAMPTAAVTIFYAFNFCSIEMEYIRFALGINVYIFLKFGVFA
jgi:hypothetical protein